jgi:hypothetical protein
VSEPLARYPLRTPFGYRVVLAVLGVLGALALAALAFLSRWAGTLQSALVLAGIAVIAATPVWYWFASRVYRVAGGHGEIAMFRDRLVVADARHRIELPAETLEVGGTRYLVRYTTLGIPVAQREAGVLITLRSGARKHVFSSKLFADQDWLAGFYMDVVALRAGEMPLGPRVVNMRPPRPRVVEDGYDYDARLDRELANVD